MIGRKPRVNPVSGPFPGWLLALLLLVGASSVQAQPVWLVELDGAIGPATADFVIRSLEDAAESGVSLVVLRINTPGGLDASMRDIIQSILSSPVPVASWVAPGGARAASAGTYILYASHYAAMAEATNVGSSTPVNLGGEGSPLPLPSAPEEPAPGADGNAPNTDPASLPGTAMERKVINDAVAYIRGLAELRGRNVEWAERTVREAANLPAFEALEQNVIDLIANDVNSLLSQLNGRVASVQNRTLTLELDEPVVTSIEPDWRHNFLALITDPNIAYILLMIGVYGLILEFYNPGMGLPGITGVICLLLGAFALQMLPINFVGLALILIGIGLMVAEAMSPSFGVFGLGGIAAFVLGSVMLMDTELEAFQISLGIVAAFAAASAGIFFFAVGAIVSNRNRRVTTGVEGMIGGTAVAKEDFDSTGKVFAFSENWGAETDEPVARGDKLYITGVDGLRLRVSHRQPPGGDSED